MSLDVMMYGLLGRPTYWMGSIIFIVNLCQELHGLLNSPCTPLDK